MANVELKQPIIQEIASQVEGAQAVVLVDYRGLNVAQDTELRKGLRDAGIVYKVYKNTMMKRAFEGTDFEKLDPVLDGPNAIAISKDDATAPARVIAKYAKTMPAIEIKAGVVEGNFYDAAGMQAIASIPPREELLAKLLGSLQSPIANFARVLDQLAEKGGWEAIAPEEVKEEPAAEEAAPAAEEAAPTAEEAAPAAEEAAPAAEKPAAEEAPAEEKPKAEKAPAKKEKPAAEKPAAEEAPAEEKPKAEKAPAKKEKPAAKEPAAEEAPAEEKPKAEKAPAKKEKPAAKEPAAEKPAAKEPAKDETAE